MKVAGFTIVRNAIKYDYPVLESIRSVLPIVDVFYVGVGNSEDQTLELIGQINDAKIKVIETVWDDALREGGRVLALETNKVFDLIPQDFDWCFYIQADEVVHEQDYNAIKDAMKAYNNVTNVDGLLFNYVHFYGTYDYVGNSRRWYRNEIRLIKNKKTIRSYKDAQGFRHTNDEKLKVKKINARIFHYGWVKHPARQKEKEKNFHRMWHDDKWMQQHVKDEPEFDYSCIDSLQRYAETHPGVMAKRIHEKNWDFVYDESKRQLKIKDRVLLWFEKTTGKRLFEYKNYEEI